jgi:hypothetical protein
MLLNIRSAALSAAVVLTMASALSAQQLAPNKQETVSLTVGETKEFTIRGKKGDFWRMNDSPEWKVYPDITLTSPSGDELLSQQQGYVRALVLPEDGDYTLGMRLVKGESGEEMSRGPYDITFSYTDVFTLPKGSVRTARRVVAGYVVEIFKATEEYITTLRISRNGKPEVILLGDSMMPFEFADVAAQGRTAAERRAAQLWRTPDKTGDGIPDIAVQYYSGGAHCCFDMLFYELGKTVKKARSLSTADAGVTPMRVVPGKGLRLRTADMSFAYWNMSYAGSPAPIVILDFDDGEWRPNFAAMRKPAPPEAELKKRADAARAKLTAAPYKSDDAYFEEAFWGEMLDLIYTGNEAAAWRYFDMVWRNDKPGKEAFLEDFKNQLMLSQFWQMILVDRPNPSAGR